MADYRVLIFKVCLNPDTIFVCMLGMMSVEALATPFCFLTRVVPFV